MKPKLNDAFWRWFGDSVVRNEDGSPMVVYHGTHSKFENFDPRYSFHLGFHFGTLDQAKRRLKTGAKEHPLLPRMGDRIIAAYLSIQNPLESQDAGDWVNSYRVWKTLDKATDGAFGEYDFALNEQPVPNRHRLIVSLLKQMGYDGIVYRNQIEGTGESWIAFDPSQIKSIDNDGTWDADDPSIGSNPVKSTMTRVDQWPDDFQQILHDILWENEIIGLHDTVSRVPTKMVKTLPYWSQARSWGYASGDNRSDPAYIKAMKLSLDEKFPPIIIDGDALVDGRHRLLAVGPAKEIEAIDLEDIRAENSSLEIVEDGDDNPSIGSNPSSKTALPLVSVPTGTMLYHGTDSPKNFTMLRGPSWLVDDIRKAEEWAGWSESGGGGEKRVLKFSTKKTLKLLDTRALRQWRRVGILLMDDDDPCMWSLARKVAEAGFDGWLGNTEVMISRPKDALIYRGTTEITDFINDGSVPSRNPPEIDGVEYGYAGIREGFKITGPYGETAIGYAYSADFPNDIGSPSRGELFLVSVPEEARGRGAGKAISIEALKLMTSHGAETVVMHATSVGGQRIIDSLIMDGYISEPIRASSTGKKEYRIHNDGVWDADEHDLHAGARP